MPTQIGELNQSLVYTWCPQCRAQGNDRSPLTRDMHVIRCNLGHQFTGAQLQAMGADMVKAGEIFHETPTLTDIKWAIWVNPKVKEKLEVKFANRLMVTLGTFLAAIADDSIVMITGEQASELRKLGVKNGSEMLSAIKTAKETERERDEAIKAIEKFQAVLHAAGVPGA